MTERSPFPAAVEFLIVCALFVAPPLAAQVRALLSADAGAPVAARGAYPPEVFALALCALALYRPPRAIPLPSAQLWRGWVRAPRVMVAASALTCFGVLCVSAAVLGLLSTLLPPQAHAAPVWAAPPVGAARWLNFAAGTLCAAFTEEFAYRLYLPETLAHFFRAPRAAERDSASGGTRTPENEAAVEGDSVRNSVCAEKTSAGNSHGQYVTEESPASGADSVRGGAGSNPLPVPSACGGNAARAPRGIRRLPRPLSPARAIAEAVPLVLFAAAHGYLGAPAVANALVCGAALRVCLCRSRSLAVCAAVHALYNSCTFAAMWAL